MFTETIRFLRDFHAMVSFGTLLATLVNVLVLDKVCDLLGGDFGVAGRSLGPGGRGRWWVLRWILVCGGVILQILMLGFTFFLIATIPWGVSGKGGTVFSVLMCLILLSASLFVIVFFCDELR